MPATQSASSQLQQSSSLQSQATSARRSQLEQELAKLYGLENTKAVDKNGRLKSTLLGILRGGLQGFLTTGSFAGGLGGMISGGIPGVVHPQWDEELKQVAEVNQQRDKVSQALAIEKELTQLDHLDLQNNALRGETPAALSKRRQGLMRELQGLMKITGGKFDPNNARQVEIANELQITPQNKPSGINWQSVRVLRGADGVDRAVHFHFEDGQLKGE